ncbi:hypothetical protein FACS1894132_13320 [Clostridia bacterium]|nr:hypothetical protein FACS1894132_13320 [Clostridia bacterium]
MQDPYKIFISDITEKEISCCEEKKKINIANFLAQIKFQKLDINTEVEEISNEIINAGILTQKSYDDCLHIAVALVNSCDIILSWNFKHIVNIKTINGIRKIIVSENYKAIDIYSPNVLLERDDEND